MNDYTATNTVPGYIAPVDKQYTLNDAIKSGQNKAQRLVALASEIKSKLTGGGESVNPNPEKACGMIGAVDEIGFDIDQAIDILAVVNERLA